MLGMGQDGFQASFVRLDQALLRLEQRIKDRTPFSAPSMPSASMAVAPNPSMIDVTTISPDQSALQALEQRQAALEAALMAAQSSLGLAAEQVRMVLMAEKDS